MHDRLGALFSYVLNGLRQGDKLTLLMSVQHRYLCSEMATTVARKSISCLTSGVIAAC